MPLYNLRAVCTNRAGASTTYTWRGVDLASERDAHETARFWGEHFDRLYANPQAPQCQLAKVETSLPTDAEIAAEGLERSREWMEGEIAAGAFDEDFNSYN
jgi:hypothetical protein